MIPTAGKSVEQITQEAMAAFEKYQAKDVISKPQEDLVEKNASEYIEKVLDLSRSTTAPKRNRLIAEERRPSAPSKQTPSSQWEHHKLTEGIELHVDNSLSPDRKKLVQRLMKYAKQLFSKS
jgi:hypothetical protein